MSEKALQDKVIKYLKALRKKGVSLFWEKRQSGGFIYRLGLPDLYIVVNGKHLEIELKDPREKITYKSEQLLWKEEFEKMKIRHIISNNYDEIIKFINEGVENE